MSFAGFLERSLERWRSRPVPEGIRITKVGLWFVLFTVIVGVAATTTGNNALYLVLSAMLALLVVSAILIYNRLVKLRARVNNGWSQIDVQLRRRYDLIPNLVKTVQGYATHERELFENVTEARSRAIDANAKAMVDSRRLRDRTNSAPVLSTAKQPVP